MTNIVIVRHGETMWNVEGRMQGHRDIELNENGLRQAMCLADRLKHTQWDAIVSSDLQRAIHTADHVAAYAGGAARLYDPRLRERSFGRLEGTTKHDRVQQWGEAWETLEHGIESDEALFERAYQCLEETERAFAGRNVLLVSHGGLIKQLMAQLFPDAVTSHPGNTAVSIVHKKDSGWQCALYNCMAHIEA